MKSTIKLFSLTLILLSLVLVSSVSAQQAGPYFNLSIGQSDVDTDISDFDKGTSFSLGVGYSFNKNFAIEANYIDFGDADDDIFPVWTLSADALVACVVGKIPFSPMVTGYGKIGLASWDAELAEEGFGTFATDDGSDLTFGLGLLFSATGKVSGFVQYQLYEFDDTDVDNMSLGVQFGF